MPIPTTHYSFKTEKSTKWLNIEKTELCSCQSRKQLLNYIQSFTGRFLENEELPASDGVAKIYQNTEKVFVVIICKIGETKQKHYYLYEPKYNILELTDEPLDKKYAKQLYE